MTKNPRIVAPLVAGRGVGLVAFGRLSLLMTICLCDSWRMDVGDWWEERSSVGGATLDSGSWRLFFNLNSLRGTKSVPIFSKLVSARSSSSGIVFASKLSVAATAITLNLSLLFYTTKILQSL